MSLRYADNFILEDEMIPLAENIQIKGYYNVKEYGVVGDGETNDYQAIQDLIDSINSGTIFFPKGIYKLGNDHLTLKSNINLIGDHATILFNDTAIATVDTYMLDTPNVDAVKTYNNIISGFTFDGNTVGLWGLRLSNINDLLVKNNRFVKLLDLAGTPCSAIVILDNSHNIRICDNDFNVSDYGIVIGTEKFRLLPNTTEHNSNITISNNNINIVWGSCIGVNQATKNITISGNTCQTSARGIGIKCGEGVAVPIQLHVEDVVISGNTIYNPLLEGHGIRVSQNVYSVNITGNTINGYNEALWVSGNVNLDGAISKGVSILFNSNQITNSNYGVYCYNNVSQPKININDNAFFNCDVAIYGVFFWSSLDGNRILNARKGIMLERAYYCNVSNNVIENTQQEAILYTTAENGTSNTSPVITGNLIHNASVEGNGLYSAIVINNLRVIINGNYINNTDSKVKYIIECGAPSNNKIITSNLYRGAITGFLDITGSNDQIANNISLGS